MKLSTSWLNNFLSLDDLKVEDLAQKLTMGAFEVEDLKRTGPKLKGPIVVGKILKIEKHPNADRLSLTNVTTDGKNELLIVCGAKNIQVGQKVPVCLDGAIVINRQDGSELVIKTSKIRQVESFGMICSPGELGIKTEDPNGILILPENAPLGQNVIDYLSLKGDTVLEVASRSNRGDALSVYGLSREISALTGKKLKELSFKTPEIDNSVELTEPKIENPEDTIVFYTVTIEDLTIKESPPWLKNLLDSVAIRSINNIVDITNYINFTFGQPLHAYDREKLKGKRLSARLCKKNEKITTIDSKTYELSENILVIADESAPVAIAGIMGAKESEVTENTKNIVLEAAVFNSARIRRGSRTVGLTSEASKRFERGVDSSFTYNALLKAIELILETNSSTAGKPKIGKIIQIGEPKKSESTIKLRIKEVKRVLGIEINTNEAKNLLERLGFKTKILNEKEIEAKVPSFRTHDVSREVDLIEEIARLYGYDKIPSLPPPVTNSAKPVNKALENIKNHFLACSFSETYLSSLIGDEILSKSDFPFDTDKAVRMINPLSKEHSVLRQSLIPGLLLALKLNQSHQNLHVRLFEIGKVYSCEKKPTEKESGVNEKLVLSGILAGQKENWLVKKENEKSASDLFFNLKGIIDSLLSKTKCEYGFHKKESTFTHPNFTLGIFLDKKEIGLLGCLHPKLEKKLEVNGPVMLFEINLELILHEIEKTRTFEKISSMPIVERDLTCDLRKDIEAAKVQEEIKKIISKFVTDIALISVYELDKDTKSLTFRLKMQDFGQTLTAKQIEDELNSIKSHLKSCFLAKFRV